MFGDETIKIPKGTSIFECRPIKPLNISEKGQWFYELKTTGQCFSGNLEEFKKLLKMIDEILESY